MSDIYYSRDKVDEMLKALNTTVNDKVDAILDEGFAAIMDECKVEVKTEVEDTVTIIGLNESVANINKILKECRNVQFSKNGTYQITSPLVIHSNTVIDLNGATIRREVSASVVVAYVDPNATTGYNGVHDVVIKNGTIEGINTKGYNPTNLTSWMHCNNIRFENVTFLDNPGHHCIDLAGCSNMYIMNCKFLGYCSYGNDYAESVQIDYAAYLSLPSYPVGSTCYDMTYCKNIVIDGCTFGASEDRPAQYCAIGSHSQGDDYNFHQDIVIRNCIATGNGVTDSDPSYGAFVRCMKYKNVLIENNVVGNYGRMVWITMPKNLCGPDGVYALAEENPDKVINVENLQIIGNRLVSRGSNWQCYGVYMKDTFGKSKNIVIQDCDLPSSAVYISGCTNVMKDF